MAKVQSFADKVKKKTAAELSKNIKLIFSYQSPDTGAWRFGEKFIKVRSDEDEIKIIDDEIKKGKAVLEQN